MENSFNPIHAKRPQQGRGKERVHNSRAFSVFRCWVAIVLRSPVHVYYTLTLRPLLCLYVFCVLVTPVLVPMLVTAIKTKPKIYVPKGKPYEHHHHDHHTSSSSSASPSPHAFTVTKLFDDFIQSTFRLTSEEPDVKVDFFELFGCEPGDVININIKNTDIQVN